jgi:hypothetical protein
MATAIQASSSASTFPGSISSRDAFSGGSSSPDYPYSHKRGGSTQLSAPRMPKTQPPRSPPPQIPTYDFQVHPKSKKVKAQMADFVVGPATYNTLSVQTTRPYRSNTGTNDTTFTDRELDFYVTDNKFQYRWRSLSACRRV